MILITLFRLLDSMLLVIIRLHCSHSTPPFVVLPPLLRIPLLSGIL